MSDSPERLFDLIIRGGEIYDGSGGPPYRADVGISRASIAAMGKLDGDRTGREVDATGMAVAPGFINMLSHSYQSILRDPRSLSELLQGVTTQIFGEGWSMGPLTPEMRASMWRDQPEPSLEVTWSTLAEYLAHVEKRGTSQNVASYVGATTLRIHAVGQDDRPPAAGELDLMRGLVEEEMSAGALGIGSSLIYPPAFFASTEELVELCRVASRYGGKYISHIRNEGAELLQAVDELVRISREGNLPAEIYHLKASGRPNWDKLEGVIQRVEDARAAGDAITADMYTYTAGATGLSAAIPPRFHDGGPGKLLQRLEDPAVRREIRDAIENSAEGWENLYQDCGGAEGVLILGVRKPEHRCYQGKTLAEIASMDGNDPVEALIDLVRRDRSRVETAYFSISEGNVRRQIALPWVSFGSDAVSMAAEGAWLEAAAHPRAYGTFARLLGHYVRDEKLIPLPEAIRRLTRLPADNLELDRRGRLEEGYFADVVVFDPSTIGDRATYANPHQYAVGVRDVVVNGRLALNDGAFTGELAGRALHGPGRRH